MQRQPSVKDEGFFSKATKMKLLAGGCVATVAGSGYAYHQWNTDVEFRIEWTIYLTELVYGPQPGASPFTVEDLTIGDDLRTCLGRVFLAIDLKESSGFSKLQCLEFVDNIGFDVRNTLALSDLWLDQLLRPIGFEKLRLEYRLRQEEAREPPPALALSFDFNNTSKVLGPSDRTSMCMCVCVHVYMHQHIK